MWQVFSQLTLARELEDTVKEKKENFTRIQEFYNQSHDQFMEDIEKVYSHSREVEETLMETKVRIISHHNGFSVV